VVIRGEQGTIRFAIFDEAPVVLLGPDAEERVEIPHPPHVQQPLIQQVVDALLGRGVCVSTGASASRTNHVLDALLEGYRAGAGGA
jgi:hypothetical protein